MIKKIESQGYYIDQCRLEGESKANDHVPAQHNTIQMSQDRWFIIYETRSFRGSDDNRSVIYQVRKDTPDGQVLSEGCLDKSDQDWDPLGDGSHYVKLCNHSVAFGVPQGAVINGKPAVHGGYFAASWRANPRVLDRQRDYLLHETEVKLSPESYRDYWVQFKLNDSEDDIEIISPVAPLRQKGYEEGEAVCRHEEFVQMNQSYVVPVPYNRDCTEWAFLLHWGGGVHTLKSVCTAILYRWNESIKRYEWVETGPILDGPNGMGIFEGAIAPYKDDWLVSARVTQRNYLGNVWFRTDDLFDFSPEPIFSDSVRSICPRTTFHFPDGIVRVCTTDQEKSPYNHLTDVRIPLNILDIDPDDNYRITKSAVVFDSIKEGLPIQVESAPTIHFCRLLPHTGGNKGKLTYFVRPRGLKHPLTAGRNKGLLKREDMLISGVYHSEITYDNEFPPTWQFHA